MKHPDCDFLESYFDNCLPAARRAEFDRHLSMCSRCQGELRALQRMNELLGSAGDELGVVPGRLSYEIAHRLQSSRHRFWRRSAFVAAAALAFLSVVGAWWRMGPGARPRPIASRGGADVNLVQVPTGSDAALAEQESAVRLTFDRNSDAIVVPIKSQDPSVSIFWIYPTARETAKPGTFRN